MESTLYGNGSLSITWPESELGVEVVKNCPCGGAQDTASRMCGGTYSDGVVWDDPNTSQCPLGETTISLCMVSTGMVS